MFFKASKECSDSTINKHDGLHIDKTIDKWLEHITDKHWEYIKKCIFNKSDNRFDYYKMWYFEVLSLLLEFIGKLVLVPYTLTKESCEYMVEKSIKICKETFRIKNDHRNFTNKKKNRIIK